MTLVFLWKRTGWFAINYAQDQIGKHTGHTN